MAGSTPMREEIIGKDEVFSQHVADWGTVGDQVNQACQEQGYPEIERAHMNQIMYYALTLVGTALRTHDPDNQRALLNFLGIKVTQEASGEGDDVVTRHEHEGYWEVPSDTPDGAVVWTATCTYPDCGQRLRVMKD